MQSFPAQAQLVQGRGPERGDEDIGVAQQTRQHRLALAAFEIGLHRSHPLVHGLVSHGTVMGHGVATGGGGTRRGGRFEFGAMRAHAMQAHQSSRSWQVQGQAEHTHAAQNALFTG
jgi:hypothetical protein